MKCLFKVLGAPFIGILWLITILFLTLFFLIPCAILDLSGCTNCLSWLNRVGLWADDFISWYKEL